MKSSSTWDNVWQKHRELDNHPDLIKLINKYSPGKNILEVGFGTAGDLITLSKLGYNCYGLEKSKIAYNRAKRFKKLKIYYGDGESSNFPANKFDLVYHQGLLEHFKNPKELLNDHKRILKDQGVVVVDVPHKWNLFTVYKKTLQFFDNWYGGWERSYSSREIIELFNNSGFEEISVTYRGIFPHQWGKFLFPERIVKNTNAAKIITKTPVKYFQLFMKNIYKRNKFLQIVSTYNIIIVARKK